MEQWKTAAAWRAAGRWTTDGGQCGRTGGAAGSGTDMDGAASGSTDESGAAGGGADEGTGRRTNTMHTRVHGGRED